MANFTRSPAQANFTRLTLLLVGCQSRFKFKISVQRVHGGTANGTRPALIHPVRSPVIWFVAAIRSNQWCVSRALAKDDLASLLVQKLIPGDDVPTYKPPAYLLCKRRCSSFHHHPMSSETFTDELFSLPLCDSSMYCNQLSSQVDVRSRWNWGNASIWIHISTPGQHTSVASVA